MLQLIVVPTFFSRVSDPTHETVTGKTVMEKTTRALSVLSASLPTRQDVCHTVLSSVPGHHCRSWPAVCCIDFTAQLGVQLAAPTSASLSETLITREKGYQLSFPVPTVSFHMMEFQTSRTGWRIFTVHMPQVRILMLSLVCSFVSQQSLSSENNGHCFFLCHWLKTASFTTVQKKGGRGGEHAGTHL